MDILRRGLVFLAISLAIAGGSTAHAAYWSLFNFEGESAQPAIYVTYATLADMLIDQNRTGTFVPDGFGAANNVIGSGSDSIPSVSVPEPGTLALLGLGLAGFWAARRRER
jgi:PEP-CTERM motif